MPRKTKTFTFSLPSEMVERVDERIKQQGQTRSEFLRRAVLRYVEECEWSQLLQYGERRARERGIGPEEVVSLVDECRSEAQSEGTSESLWSNHA